MPFVLAKMYLYMLLGNKIYMPCREICFWREKNDDLVGAPQFTSIIIQAQPMDNNIKADKPKLPK